ncbi:MAG: LysR family transcriptional regulator [bacterium]
MEMHQIKYFLAVTRTLNFTRAADQCNVTQPSLTRAIQKLEDEFGGLLFNRERALTHLTELGRMVLPHLEQTFDAAEAATTLASSIGRAEVTPLVIGVAQGVASPVLDEILGSLATALPGLTIDLRGGTSDQLIDLSLKGGMDLLLIAPPDVVPDRLEIWPLFTQTYKMAVGSGHPLAKAGPPCMADVMAGPWIDCADEATAFWRSVTASAGLDPSFRHRADNPDLALRLVRQGLGLAMLPVDTKAEGVILVGLADHGLGQNIVLAAVAGRRRGRAADAFLRIARARDWQPAGTGHSACSIDDRTASTASGSAR